MITMKGAGCVFHLLLLLVYSQTNGNAKAATTARCKLLLVYFFFTSLLASYSYMHGRDLPHQNEQRSQWAGVFALFFFSFKKNLITRFPRAVCIPTRVWFVLANTHVWYTGKPAHKHPHQSTEGKAAGRRNTTHVGITNGQEKRIRQWKLMSRCGRSEERKGFVFWDDAGGLCGRGDGEVMIVLLVEI